jgi:hypothetical protein
VEYVREQRDERVQVLELVRDLARVGGELPEDDAMDEHALPLDEHGFPLNED